jgi:nucleoside-diphosphate-sugar epimerase
VRIVRIFVAGAGGVLGCRLARRLVDRGHDVVGFTRSQEHADVVESTGAHAVVGDALDGPSLGRAVVETDPEAIVNELTALPRHYRPRSIEPFYRQTSRLRVEGTRRLLVAARGTRCRHVVVQSIAFLYAPEGDPVRSEDAPIHVDAPEPLGAAVRAVAEMEETLLATPSVRGVALRYGFVYGPDTHYAPGGTIHQDVVAGRSPVVGAGEGVFSFVHVDDAVSATVLALEGTARGIFNVVDDDPAPVGEWLPEFARILGAPEPVRLTRERAIELLGRARVEMLTTQRGARNERARSQLGFEPRFASWRQGFRDGGVRGRP